MNPSNAAATSQQFGRTIVLLVYEDIPAAHDFLVTVFGFTPGGIHRDNEGRAVHGEVRAGEQEIWLHRVTAEHRLASPKALPPAGSGLVVFVPDVDAHFQRVSTLGATILREPQNQFYGQRDYGVSDLEGHRWWFATPLKPGLSAERLLD